MNHFRLELLRQPEIEPLNNAPITLLLDISLVRNIEIAAHGKAMADALEQLKLILLLPVLHNLPRPLPLLGREGMVVFSAREEKRLCKILELFVRKGARMRKSTGGNEAVRCQAIEHVRRAEAVAHAAVFGGLLAIFLGNCLCPFWHRCSREADVLVSPSCVVEARVRGLVVFVLSVLPNWILLSLDACV